MITRRNFLLGTLGAGFVTPTFAEKAMAFVANHSEPLLSLPRDPARTLYVATDCDLQFRLDELNWEIPHMTYGEYYDEVCGGVETYMELNGFEADELWDLDEEVDPYDVLELLGRTESPNAKAYRLLEDLQFVSDSEKFQVMSCLEFIDGPCPGNDYLGVHAKDLLAVSFVQHEMNKLGWNVAVELA